MPERPNVAGWLIALIVIVALLLGGILGYTQRQPSDENVVARGLVGPDGATLTFPGGGQLVIPRNALPTATVVKIRKETVDRSIRLGVEGDPRVTVYDPGELVVYVFEPPDLNFQAPVTIVLPRHGSGSAVLVDDRGEPRVVAGEVKGDTVTIETTSFAFDTGSAVGRPYGQGSAVGRPYGQGSAVGRPYGQGSASAAGGRRSG
jgi:hypothetical protein